MTTKTAKEATPAAPQPLTDEHPLYQKTLSILAAIQEVQRELAAEADRIRQANPDVMFPAGYGERAALAESLTDGYRGMISEVRRTAKSSGLTMPEDLR